MRRVRLSIPFATSAAVVFIGALFVLLAWAAGTYFRAAALQSQSQSLSRVIEVATNQVLHGLRQQLHELHTSLEADGSLVQALNDYYRGEPELLLGLLDDPLRNGFAGRAEIRLTQLRIYDLQLQPLALSGLGEQGLGAGLPAFLADLARGRDEVERLKAVGGLWRSANGPRYSLLLPLGGLKPVGYLELVIDPGEALYRVSAATGMPLSVAPASAKPPDTSASLRQEGLLPVEYLLHGDDGQPAYRLIGMEDVSDFQQAMHTNQLVTTAAFVAITALILLLLLLMLNRGIFRPLRNLLQGIELYRAGELETRIPSSGLRELHTLGVTFNSMIEQIRHDIDELERFSNRDGLTGLSNRRYFEQRLQEEWSLSTRQQRPIALLFIDIDYFKRYNDHYGHLRGDDCLRRVAEAIGKAVKRDIDVAARYGGEEFVILLPGTDLSGAEQVARELQTAIRHLHIEHRSSNVEPFVTLSIGIASLIPRFPDKPEELLHAADTALYEAKHHGRNCIGKASTGS